MAWQPMPPPAIEPSGTTVERLCGQPQQKYAVRAIASGAARRRTASSVAIRTRIDSGSGRPARREATSGAIESASSSPEIGTSGFPDGSSLPMMRGCCAAP